MGVCDVPVISNVCDAAGEASATLVSAPFDWLASTMGQAARWLIEAMWTVFDSTTLVDVTADGYLGVYNLLFGIGVFIVVLFFCFQLILGSFLVITVTATALEIVDQLSIGIVQAAGETTATMGDKITLLTAGLTTINVAAPGVGAIVTIFLAGLMICAVAIVWFSLLIRKALLLVAIVLAPVAFAGAAWDLTRSWIGKWAAFVVALIVSKLVLVVVFLIAITQISTPIEADLAAVTEPISGIVLLFIAAFVEDLVETARRIAARSPGARLDPPLLLALDEIGNLAPLPSLPTLMAEGGGTGITTMPVLQSLAQARDKWNENQAGAIWDASIVKIILGGASNSRDLQDLATLIGERDDYTDSVTLGDHGTRSNQRSVRRVPILPPDRIRTLPFGTGVILLRSTPPIITDLHPWPKRPDAPQLHADRASIETLLQTPPTAE
jgi:Type IV secretory pathway, VirD4 components